MPDATRREDPLAAIPGTVPALTLEFEGCRFAPRCDRAHDACRAAPPALLDLGGRQVRCVLYGEGAKEQGGGTPPTGAEPAPAAAAPIAQGATNQPLLAVDGLSVRFPIRSGLLRRISGSFTAVDRVSFEIGAGETLALVGESGSGKTTTGKAIAQLLRRSAQVTGRAVLAGQDLCTLDGDALRAARRDIQIIFQDPFASLNPRRRVAEILEEGLVTLRPEMDAAARRAAIEALVEQVGLRRDALERHPHEFSGGQRQRIAIARALAVRPKLIVCDEPTSALDVSVQAQILNLLRALQRAHGLAYLFITHNIGVVEYIADRVAVMRNGRIEEAGRADAVLGAPQTDYTRTLLAAVPRIQSGAPA